MIGYTQMGLYEIGSAKPLISRIYDIAVGKLYAYFKSKASNIIFKGKSSNIIFKGK